MYKNLRNVIRCHYYGLSVHKEVHVASCRRLVTWGAERKEVSKYSSASSCRAQQTEYLEKVTKTGVVERLNFYFHLLSTLGA